MIREERAEKDNVNLAGRVREILEQDGWIQGMYHSDVGHCLLGALTLAGKEQEYREYLPTLHRLSDRVTGKEFSDHQAADQLVFWNDSPGRTKEDVILLLKGVEAETDG